MSRIFRRSAVAASAAAAAVLAVCSGEGAAVAADPPVCGQHVGGVTVSNFDHIAGGCTLFGPGTFTLAAGGTARMSMIYLRGGLTLRNEATAYLTRCVHPGLKVNAGTVFENVATFSTESCGISIDGDGIMRNDAGATLDLGRAATVSPTLTNDGTIVAAGGQPYLADLTNLSNGTLTGGTYDVRRSSLVLPGAIGTNASDIRLESGSSLQTPLRMDALAGLTENQGLLELDVDQATGPLRNDGTLTIGAGATVSPSGATSLAGAGTLHLAADAAGVGALSASGPLSVDGALAIDVGSGFQPTVGQSFTLASSAAGVSGTFTSVSGLDLNADEHLTLHYSSTAITATVDSTALPPLTVTGISPATIVRGAPAHDFTVTGTGFAPDAIVGFGSSDVVTMSTTYVDGDTLTVKARATAKAKHGPRDVRVRNVSQRVAAGCTGCLNVVPPSPSRAQTAGTCTIYWKGATSSDWTVPANWSLTDGGPSGTQVPAASDFVCSPTARPTYSPVLGSGSVTVAGIDFATAPLDLTVLNAGLVIGSAAGSFDSLLYRAEFGDERGYSSIQGLGGTADVSVDSYVDASRGTTTLDGPGVLTILHGASISTGALTLSGGRKLLVQGALSTSYYAETITLDDTSVLENAGTFGVGSGSGSIVGTAPAQVINDASGVFDIDAYQHTYLINAPFTNNGAVDVTYAKLDLRDVTNLADGVLTGGSWSVDDSATLVVPGPIVTNAAQITVAGDASVLASPRASALKSLTTNTGSLTITYSNYHGAASLTLSRALTNTGMLTVGYESTLVTPSYTQTAGTTSLGGTLQAGSTGTGPVHIRGGTLQGALPDATYSYGRGYVKGVLDGAGNIDLTTLYDGVSATSWTAAGGTTLSIGLSETTNGVGYSRFAIAGTAMLAGTLVLTTTTSTPVQVGTTVHAVTAGSVHSRFAHVIGQAIGDGTYWQVVYTSTGVDLVLRQESQLAMPNWSAPERDSGSTSVIVPVTLNTPSSVPVTVSYSTADGTAEAGSDYLATSGMLTFPAGWTTRAIRVPVLGDTTVEPDETFTITLSGADFALLPSSPSTVTILNDDPAGTVPTIAGIDPNTIGQGAQARVVTITGTNFAPNAVVGFGTSDLVPTATVVDSPTRIRVTVTASATAALGTLDVRVRNPGAGLGICNSCLIVQRAPVVQTATSLAQGAQNQLVMMTGHDLVAGASVAITAGGVTVGDLSVTDATHAAVPVSVARTAATGRYDVTITNPDGGTSTCVRCFVVTAGPKITSITPDVATRGTSVNVTIEGKNFVPGTVVTGPAGVTFDTIVVLDEQTITARMSISANASPGTNRTVTVSTPASAGYGTGVLAGLTVV